MYVKLLINLQFDLGCQEWLRALAGTLNSVGTLLVLPITGYISDHWGRRVALSISIFNLALIGLIRAFSVNYPMYLALQLFQTTLGGGTFSSAYVFGAFLFFKFIILNYKLVHVPETIKKYISAAEMVGPKFRVVTSATMTSMFSVGQVTLGAVAWAIPNWRHLIIALHVPCFLVVSYYWILSESVRWLLSKHKYDEAREVLTRVSRMNRKEISEKSMTALLTPPAEPEVKSIVTFTKKKKHVHKNN